MLQFRKIVFAIISEELIRNILSQIANATVDYFANSVRLVYRLTKKFSET